jgi:hypothetical protein
MMDFVLYVAATTLTETSTVLNKFTQRSESTSNTQPINTEPQSSAESTEPQTAMPTPQRIEKNTRDQFSVEELYQIDRDRIKPEDKMDFAKERVRRKEEAEDAIQKSTAKLTSDSTQINIQNNP